MRRVTIKRSGFKPVKSDSGEMVMKPVQIVEYREMEDPKPKNWEAPSTDPPPLTTARKKAKRSPLSAAPTDPEVRHHMEENAERDSDPDNDAPGPDDLKG